ncbi:MAG TPA: sigma-70 family RNA polymerase sigma factor [Terriglobales bacterium]|nr:sigma-70 family RNA polymerase sigma factor [Terriglobales bacterium]
MEDWLTQKFEKNRPHLRAVAYRMLGSLSEADDAVQEAWLRLNRSETRVIGNLDGWLTTVVARVCLDELRSRDARREEPLDAHVPDLIVSREDGIDPEQEALIADSVGIAMLIVLEMLAPPERLAFVLHDIFAIPFAEIASVVGCSTVAARQFASRARRKVQGAANFPDVDLKQQRKVVDAFLAAVRGGDLEALVAVFDPDIVIRTDQGTLRELRGARSVAEKAMLFSQLTQSTQPVRVNGIAGLLSWRPDGQAFAIMSFTVRGKRIVEIDVVRDPNRLRRLGLEALS